MAFGGPQAHVAILRDHLVVQRDWLEEDAFMELFAIGQVGVHTHIVYTYIYIVVMKGQEEWMRPTYRILLPDVDDDDSPISSQCYRVYRVPRVPSW